MMKRPVLECLLATAALAFLFGQDDSQARKLKTVPRLGNGKQKWLGQSTNGHRDSKERSRHHHIALDSGDQIKAQTRETENLNKGTDLDVNNETKNIEIILTRYGLEIERGGNETKSKIQKDRSHYSQLCAKIREVCGLNRSPSSTGMGNKTKIINGDIEINKMEMKTPGGDNLCQTIGNDAGKLIKNSDRSSHERHEENYNEKDSETENVERNVNEKELVGSSYGDRDMTETTFQKMDALLLEKLKKSFSTCFLHSHIDNMRCKIATGSVLKKYSVRCITLMYFFKAFPCESEDV